MPQLLPPPPLMGSPPLARGRPRSPCRLPARLRSTPTRVGTTLRSRVLGAQSSVHPHARGDDDDVTWVLLDDRGPPPRAWGRQTGGGCRRRHLRSTPTRVGTTLDWRLPCLSLPVHPHARGDDAASARREELPHGPPPRAWGRPVGAEQTARPVRSTPTRVGTTSSRRLGCHGSTVHPHARGDDATLT